MAEPKLTPGRRQALAVGLWSDAVQGGRFRESNRSSELVDLDRQGVRGDPLVYWQHVNWMLAQEPPLAVVLDRSRPDGHTYWCRACRNARRRARHISRATGAPMGPPPLPERDGDAKQARRTVNHLVETGRIPPPNTLPCTDCGHKWTPGESRHEYDHYRGYGAGHHRDVEPVCAPCHHGRTDRRAA